VIEKTGTGCSAYSPDLYGCVATGETRDAVEREMREAIAFHLEGMSGNGRGDYGCWNPIGFQITQLPNCPITQ
jgi:predicted RNase H-like HicB family nuclease